MRFVNRFNQANVNAGGVSVGVSDPHGFPENSVSPPVGTRGLSSWPVCAGKALVVNCELGAVQVTQVSWWTVSTGERKLLMLKCVGVIKPFLCKDHALQAAMYFSTEVSE